MKRQRHPRRMRNCGQRTQQTQDSQTVRKRLIEIDDCSTDALIVSRRTASAATIHCGKKCKGTRVTRMRASFSWIDAKGLGPLGYGTRRTRHTRAHGAQAMNGRCVARLTPQTKHSDYGVALRYVGGCWVGRVGWWDGELLFGLVGSLMGGWVVWWAATE